MVRIPIVTGRMQAVMLILSTLLRGSTGGVVKVHTWLPMCFGGPCAWDAGRSMSIAATVIAERINSSKFLRGGHEMELVVLDEECSAKQGLQKPMQMVMSKDRIFAVIGCGCSGCSKNAAPLLSIARVPMISPSSSATDLSVRSTYPHFFRTVMPDGPSIKVWFVLFHSFGWSHYAMWCDTKFGKNLFAYYMDVKNSWNGSMIDVIVDPDPSSENHPWQMESQSNQSAAIILKRILATRVRGVMAMATEPFVRLFVCQMVRHGVHRMVVAHFGWFYAGWYADNKESAPCTAAEMESTTEYFIGVASPSYAPDNQPVHCDSTGSFLVKDFRAEYEMRARQMGVILQKNSGRVADAVCLAAQLFNKMIDKGFAMAQLFEMNDTTFEAAMVEMQHMIFAGVSGKVQFPANASQYGGGDRLGQNELFQKLRGAYKRIGAAIELANGTVNVTIDAGKKIMFSDGYGGASDVAPSMYYPNCPVVYDHPSQQCKGCSTDRIFWLAVGACLCKPGNYNNQSTGNCEPCLPGSYTDNVGAAVCTLCPTGHIATTHGSTACTACPRHHVSSQWRGSLHCRPCPSKSVAPEAGTSRCLANFGFFETNGSVTSTTAPGVFQECGGGKSTRYIGATSRASCMCLSGSYYSYVQDACLQCPEGLACLGDNESLGDMPVVTKPGFHSLFEGNDSFVIFRCRPRTLCLGSNRCRDGFDTTLPACGACLPDHFRTGLRCERCAPGDSLLAAFACGAMILILGGAALVMNTPPLKLHPATQFNASVMGTIITALQTMTVFYGMSFEWVDPMAVIFGAIAMSLFNVEVFRVSCLVGSVARTAASRYIRHLACLPVVASTLSIFVFAKHVAGARLRSATFSRRQCVSEIRNTLGTIYVMFFISTCATTFVPFQCYSHPTSGYKSVAAYPDILCWRSDDAHTLMVILGSLAVAFILAPGIALCIWGVAHYPRAALLGDGEYLQSYQFLFFRFRPQCYMCALPIMFRGLLISLAPTCLDDAAVQICIVSTVLLCSMSLVATGQPWRMPMANYFEVAIFAVLVMLLVCGSLAAEVAPSSKAVQYAGAFLFLTCGLTALTFALHGVRQRLKPIPKFLHFICHCKSEAAGQSRVMQQILESHTNQKCFIDSDHLIDLGGLFDSVRSCVTHLVIYLTKSTLVRPWCVGEISTAHANGIHAVGVFTDAFVLMTTEQLADLPVVLGCDGVEILAKHYISLVTAQAALENVQAMWSSRSMRVPAEPSVNDLYGVAAGILAACAGKVASAVSPIKLSQWNDGSGSGLFLCSAPADAEATAGRLLLCLIFRRLASTSAREVIDMDKMHNPATLAKFACTSAHVVMMLSNAVLSCVFCTVVVHTCYQASCSIVSVVLPGFQFPSAAFYEAGCRTLFDLLCQKYGTPDVSRVMATDSVSGTPSTASKKSGIAADMFAAIQSIPSKRASLLPQLTSSFSEGQCRSREDELVQNPLPLDWRSVSKAFKSLLSYIGVLFNTHASINILSSQAQEVALRFEMSKQFVGKPSASDRNLASIVAELPDNTAEELLSGDVAEECGESRAAFKEHVSEVDDMRARIKFQGEAAKKAGVNGTPVPVLVHL